MEMKSAGVRNGLRSTTTSVNEERSAIDDDDDDVIRREDAVTALNKIKVYMQAIDSSIAVTKWCARVSVCDEISPRCWEDELWCGDESPPIVGGRAKRDATHPTATVVYSLYFLSLPSKTFVHYR